MMNWNDMGSGMGFGWLFGLLISLRWWFWP